MSVASHPAALAARHEPAVTTRERAEDPAWNPLYRIGGIAALAILAFVPIQMAVFFIWPMPTSVVDWFALFQTNGLVALVDMDLLLIVDYVLTGLVFLALYVVLRRHSASFMTVALVAELVAIATYFASTVAFEMLSLSGRYAAATTDLERAALVAAGEVMLATWQGTAFVVSYLLAGAAALIVSVIMLRSGLFGRVAAFAGIAMGVAGLVPPTLGTVGLIFSLVSLVPMVIWLFLIGRTLMRLPGGSTQSV
jgi:hypothetical protein